MHIARQHIGDPQRDPARIEQRLDVPAEIARLPRVPQIDDWYAPASLEAAMSANCLLQKLNFQDFDGLGVAGRVVVTGGLAGLLRRYEVSRWWWPVRRWAGQAGEGAVAGRGVVRGGGYAAGGGAAAAGVV